MSALHCGVIILKIAFLPGSGSDQYQSYSQRQLRASIDIRSGPVPGTRATTAIKNKRPFARLDLSCLIQGIVSQKKTLKHDIEDL